MKFYQSFDDFFHCEIDTAFQIHRICTCGHILQSFADNRLRKNRGCGRSITGNIGCLRCNFAHHLCSHVFDRIRQFHFLRNGHTVLCYGRCAELFIDHHVASLGTERHLYRVRKLIDAAL